MPEEQKTLLRDVQSTLEETAKEQLALVRDTNEVVHSIRRMMRISFWTKLIFWALVIILPVVFIGPIMKTLQSFVPTIQVGSKSVPVFTVPSSGEIQKALQLYSKEVSPTETPTPPQPIAPTESVATTTATTTSP